MLIDWFLTDKPPRTEAQARLDIARSRFPVGAYVQSLIDGSLHRVVGHSHDGLTLETENHSDDLAPGLICIDAAVPVPSLMVTGTPDQRAQIARRRLVLWDGAE